MEPSVFPIKLHRSPFWNPNAIPAAVSTTDVGRPHVSHNINPAVYSINPWRPWEEMELSLLMMDVRNFSRSKNVDRERMSVSQFRMEIRMVRDAIVKAVMDRTLLDGSSCRAGVGGGLRWSFGRAPPLN